MRTLHTRILASLALSASLISGGCGGAAPESGNVANSNGAKGAPNGMGHVDITDTLPYDLVAVDMLDGSNGFVLGHDAENNVSTVLATTTGGGSWKQVAEFRGDTLIDFDFVDQSQGWAAGIEGYIYRTKDGGRSWTVQTAEGNEWTPQRRLESQSVESQSNKQSTALINESIASIQFINPRVGWAAGDTPSGEGLNIRGIILGTADGGRTWTELKDKNGGSVPYSLNDIWFISPTEGWAAGGTFDNVEEDILLHTSDGGRTWERQKTGTAQYLRAVHFTDAKRGWAVGLTIDAVTQLPGPSKIVATVDGGRSWSVQLTAGRSFYDVFFADPLTGIAVGDRASIYVTSTGGATWVQVTEVDTSKSVVVQPPVRLRGKAEMRAFRAVFFLDAATGWTAGEGIILKFAGKPDPPTSK